MSANDLAPAGTADPYDPDNYAGGRRDITIGASARVLGGARMEALVEQIQPPGSTVTLVTDEPTNVGGLGSAPTALQYYTASLAFAMMSHVQWFATIGTLTLVDLRIEIVARFEIAGSALKGTVESDPLEFETRIEVTSPDPPEEVVRALERAERTCFTHRALVVPVLVNRTYTLNGQPLASLPKTSEVG
jgi:hypothetical protein